LNTKANYSVGQGTAERAFESAFSTQDPQQRNREFNRFFGRAVITYLPTENRLILAKSTGSGNPQEPSNLLQALFLKPEAESEANKELQREFGTKVRLDPTAMSTFALRVGPDIDKVTDNIRLAANDFAKYELLEQQGDGLRSYATSLLGILTPDRPVTLIDEPESFLHPPQAFAFGRWLATYASDSRQVIAATHSVDILRGAISTGRNVTVCRLARTDLVTSVSILGTESVRDIARNPLLSASRVLDAAFSNGAVITEADGDRAFYERVAVSINRSSNYHFTNGQGKQSLPQAVQSLRTLGIPVAVITDLDIIRDDSDYMRILDALRVPKRTQDLIKDRVRQFRSTATFRSSKERYQKLLAASSAIAEETQREINPDHGIKLFKRLYDTIAQERDEWRELKSGGINNLAGQPACVLQDVLEECGKVGLFIVPCGELEYFLVDSGLPANRTKNQWIANALPIVSNMTPHLNRNPWRFVNAIGMFLSSSTTQLEAAATADVST
jgi:hypothetical protein